MWSCTVITDIYDCQTYACPNHKDDDIHSDHGYLDTKENPAGPTTLTE